MCTRFTSVAHSLLRFLLPTLLCLVLAACNSSSSSSSNNGDKSNDNGSDNTNDNGNNGGNGNGGSDNSNDNGNGGNGGSGSSVAKRFITLEELGKGNLFYAINLSVDSSADDSNPQITKVAEGDEQVAAFEEHSQDIQLVVTKATTAPDFSQVPAIAIMSFSLEASTDLLVFQAADEDGIESTARSSGDALRIHFLKPETDYTIWYRIGNRVIRGAGFSTTPADDTTTGTSDTTTYTWDNGLAQLATQSIRFTVRIGEPVPEFPGYIDYTPDVDINFIDKYYLSSSGAPSIFWSSPKGGTIDIVDVSGFFLHEFSQERFPDASMDIPMYVYHYNPATFNQDNSSDVNALNTLRSIWGHSSYQTDITLVDSRIFSLFGSFSFRYIP